MPLAFPFELELHPAPTLRYILCPDCGNPITGTLDNHACPTNTGGSDMAAIEQVGRGPDDGQSKPTPPPFPLPRPAENGPDDGTGGRG